MEFWNWSCVCVHVHEDTKIRIKCCQIIKSTCFFNLLPFLFLNKEQKEGMLCGWNKGEKGRRHWTWMKTYPSIVYEHRNRSLKPHKCKGEQIIVEKKQHFCSYSLDNLMLPLFWITFTVLMYFYGNFEDNSLRCLFPLCWYWMHRGWQKFLQTAQVCYEILVNFANRWFLAMTIYSSCLEWREISAKSGNGFRSSLVKIVWRL